MRTDLRRRPPREYDRSPSSLVIRNVVVAGHRTSVRLEPAMWEALREIARRIEVPIHEIVTHIDRHRTASTLTAAIRVYIVDFYRQAANLAGQQPAMQPWPAPLQNGDC
jgi:predicted DNA-binding ribbon-helix-helix protein